jgi:hypothetical protein
MVRRLPAPDPNLAEELRGPSFKLQRAALFGSLPTEFSRDPRSPEHDAVRGLGTRVRLSPLCSAHIYKSLRTAHLHPHPTLAGVEVTSGLSEDSISSGFLIGLF